VKSRIRKAFCFSFKVKWLIFSGLIFLTQIFWISSTDHTLEVLQMSKTPSVSIDSVEADRKIGIFFSSVGFLLQIFGYNP
jgi:hypothetical protein